MTKFSLGFDKQRQEPKAKHYSIVSAIFTGLGFGVIFSAILFFFI